MQLISEHTCRTEAWNRVKCSWRLRKSFQYEGLFMTSAAETDRDYKLSSKG